MNDSSPPIDRSEGNDRRAYALDSARLIIPRRSINSRSRRLGSFSGTVRSSEKESNPFEREETVSSRSQRAGRSILEAFSRRARRCESFVVSRDSATGRRTARRVDRSELLETSAVRKIRIEAEPFASGPRKIESTGTPDLAKFSKFRRGTGSKCDRSRLVP